MQPNNSESWITDTVSKIIDKMEWVSKKSRYKIPYTSIDGVHDNRISPEISWTKDNGVNWWTNGFFAGMMWQMYHITQEEIYCEIARFTEEQLDRCFEDYEGLNHDVGFMWMPTAVADYRLTGNEVSKKRGLHAANLLAGRFNPAGKFIRAWNDFGDGRDTKGWAIIDCMMNLSLLYWADSCLLDCRYTNIATNHADTALQYFLRTDGSVRHIIEFDPYTGDYRKSYGGQGYGHGSAWTRGQAWAIYGFALSYRHTKNKSYLDAAKRVAHYFISQIPEHGLIPVDFRQPQEPWIEDSTAAAIAACGILEIESHVGELEKNAYHVAACRLLKTLAQKRCNFGKDEDCILEKCTASYWEEKHEYHIIYGDYYFMEGMFRLNGTWADLW